MSGLPFLLEIGTEEIPDWMIPGALKHLGELFGGLLVANKLAHGDVKLDATPRRLVLRVDGLPERQSDSEELVTGPPKSAAAGAVAGFAKKAGVAVEALSVQQTAKGEYYGYVKKVAGRDTRAIFAEALPELILKTSFPKSMYWTAKGGPRFIRPIRWIVALLGDAVVEFELAGVKSGAVTSGHRRMGKAGVAVTIATYETVLRDNGVILSADERREKIRSEASGLGATIDAELLEVLTYLTEHPAAIRGEYDATYLTLPAEVRNTVMKHHQKYFTVDEGRAPAFVAVMNKPSDDGTVKRGNERVLRARFNDARFFWDADQKKSLAERLEDLRSVTYHRDLGSYYSKVHEIQGFLIGLPERDPSAERAAILCKCDLTTELVKEFTELQGVVGGLYAKAQGETDDVATAIYDHYQPVSMDAPIPRTRAGQLVAIADKMTTLRGLFKLGQIPSGSKDPFALRRAAQGVVKILVEGGIEFSIESLIGDDPALRDFFVDRLRHYFREVRGFAYDEVNAVLKIGLNDVEPRLTALRDVRPTADFEPLAASFKRIQNILTQADFTGGALETNLLEPGPEAELHAEFVRITTRLDGKGHREALELIATLRPKVDLFFDKVHVNVPDAALRANRLALLHAILTRFSTIADFSEIVTNS